MLEDIYLTKNPKCASCHCYWKPTEADIKTSGKIYKTCRRCRELAKMLRKKNKGKHNKRKIYCKECGGGSICEHNRQRSRCKECGGGHICEYNRERSKCKECGGSQICEHNRERNQCKNCRGASICEHDKIRNRCKECGGASICEHNREKGMCKECGGSQICQHNKQRSYCKRCGGGGICEHNKRRSRCKKCGGGSIGEHNREKITCQECGGSQICQHNRHRGACKECNLPLYLVHLQRNRINSLIKLNNLIKYQGTVDYLDCSPEYLKKHIEKQLKPGMTWDNIHIDHIKPISRFDLSDPEQFLKCVHWTNLQPLLGEDNLTKHNKWTDKDEEEWQKNTCGIIFI